MNAEILRICRATSTFQEFLDTSIALIKRMQNQGAIKRQTNFHISKIVYKYKEFEKFNIDKGQIIRSLSI